ncbi:MAG TPA: sugar transferase, partial [Bryobacteraceae bacterium]|nr:sugar transferase [Bryobacteraceae bacterium]
MSTLVRPAPVYGAPALVIQQRTGLLRPEFQRLKRVFDVIFALLLGLIALPAGLLIAAAIVIDSRGPVFFTHTRIGKGNRRFRLWKFRSMITNADEVLEEYLRAHPGMAVEWHLKHKLRNDPRVTRVGRFLRKTSLDELPQLWNVLRGDMSMVGPRPIVEAEIPKYGAAFALYSRVRPGLTGLWQVSGTNDTTYRERVELDSRYIRNWTPLV